MIFLRPWFFLFLLALIPLYYLTLKKEKYSSWKKYIKKDFIPFLLTDGKEKKVKKNSFIKIALLWTLLTLALTGPSFQKIPTTSSKPFEGTVLIADLNSLNQNTLMQLKIKLTQAINLLPDEKIGLVLFDKKGYTALPLSDDREILKELIAVLKPDVLPLEGQNFAEAFNEADKLFQNTGLKTGRILLFTGGVPKEITAFNNINTHAYKVGVLGLGNSSQPLPVLDKNNAFKRDKNNNVLLVAPDKEVLSKLGLYIEQTPNDADIKKLINQTKSLSINPQSPLLPDNFLKIDEYQDLGIYVLIVLMPFIALFFRKGLLFAFIIFIFSTPSQADFWQREDQKLYQTNQKGIQEYKEKKYLDALARFQKDKSANGLYNQGNAKAHLGNIQEAINLYSEALQKNPQHQEAAFNKAYLENLMNQEKENQQAQNNQENNQNQEQENNQE
ncbi:MAG: VWA domain-containing protein, partial [Alphaproteobacteria bacterium]|nr:VWA domain-containing protein [Alphaproteobacteria bacterium]